ncbi:MAG: radical SAM protein [Dehalococcoidia bacterium]
MIVREIPAKTILSVSQIYDYVINPYTGCQHACTYCYARFMKRFTGHKEPWGEFVDVKINALDLLQKEVSRKKPGRVWVSGVCDPYQPLESKYEMTRQSLKILQQHQWPVTVQTRSPLVLRDIDILKEMRDLEVGLSITTMDDSIRKMFEPHAPPVKARIKALAELRAQGITTFAMIAPMLPGAEGLASALAGKVDYILVDRMNYHNADWVYRKYGLKEGRSDAFFDRTSSKLATKCTEVGIDCRLVS